MRPMVGIALAAVLALTGCSDDDGGSEADASQTLSSAAGDRVAPTDLPDVPALKRAKGAVGDLELGECEVTAGKQSLSGTVTSSRKKTADYVVQVDWINKHSDVRGRLVHVERDVEPGQTREWEATATVSSGATQCVPNVRAGHLAD